MISLPAYQRRKGGKLASMTIRNLDDGLKAKLRLQAASHNRSMEEEARNILRVALSEPATKPQNLALSIRSRLIDIGGVDIEIEPRAPIPEPPNFR
jgi:antitoxin FitA